MNDSELNDMLEAAVRLGATSGGADALSAYKAAYLVFYGHW